MQLTVDHIIFGCRRVRLTWLKIFTWWVMNPPRTIIMSEIISTSFVGGRGNLLSKFSEEYVLLRCEVFGVEGIVMSMRGLKKGMLFSMNMS